MSEITDTHELSELLTICRAERSMRLEDMAKALRLSVSAISQIERGLIKPSRTTRIRIVTFLRKNGYFPKEAA